jgi:chromosome segregation ATPase
MGVFKYRYKEKMRQLEEDLELRLKVDIHELEERKNLHINKLMKTFDEKMDAWKKENIGQIQENIKLIKQNKENLENLKTDNKTLKAELDALAENKKILEIQLAEAKKQNSIILNRLAKYYNQEINMKNMNTKIISLRKKCQETVDKTKEIEAKKESLAKEINELKRKFEDAINKFKQRAEHKNNVLDQHIQQLKLNYEKREEEIEAILRQIDQVAQEYGGDHEMEKRVINDMLENIKGVLMTKTQIIKNLKYSLALATKVNFI